jgi:sporulation protein YlmC with PRC-barrel domain
VPISLVADGNDERIKLHEFGGTFESLQSYKETHFVPLANYINNDVDGKIIPMLFYPPLPVSMTHAVHPATIPVVKENLSISAELQSLEEGIDVVALDGIKVGKVKEIILHPTTDRVTHLLVTKGLLIKKRFLIPAEWLKEIHESAIKLYVDSKVVKKLPAYKQ